MHRLSMLLVLLCLLFPCLAPAAAPPPLMLAGQWHDDADVSRYWVSEKLDGVRARWDGQALWSRAGNRIEPPPGFTRGWPAQALDGELWAGRGSFEASSGIVRSHPADAAGWKQLHFMVFDLPEHPGNFSQRLQALRELFSGNSSPTLLLIRQQRVRDAAALQQLLDSVVAAGGEGLMLHHQDNRYSATRSDGLLKLKPVDDAEARVVAYLPGKGKYAGMLGALQVQRADGVRFRIGGGFKDAQRTHPPPIGSLVTYRYNGLTNNGLPRFPRFLRVREEAPAEPAR